MKITIYTPDGTPETFTDCQFHDDGADPINFTGTDCYSLRRRIVTTLPYTIYPDTPETLVDQVNRILDKYDIPPTKQ